MRRKSRFPAASAAILLLIPVLLAGCNLDPGERKARTTLFVGVDASGSFHSTGDYDNALAFLAHYIYGHLNELGGLKKPRELFVAAVGGNDPNEPKTFHPIHDFVGKEVPEIEDALRTWFPPSDSLTDFNPFFQQVARIAKERNLVLAPINVIIVTDGVPDFTVRRARKGTRSIYEEIDLSPLEYLSRNLTVRLTYVSPRAADQWRREVPRHRVRLWTVDAEIMRGWDDQIQHGVRKVEDQDRLWAWIKDNVDYRVRSFGL